MANRSERRLDIIYTTMVAELLDRALDARFDIDFDEAGLFRKGKSRVANTGISSRRSAAQLQYPICMSGQPMTKR
jgi:2'-5' RNA ligase